MINLEHFGPPIVTQANNYQKSNRPESNLKDIYLILCNSCFWSASYLRKLINYRKETIRICPICKEEKLEIMPICYDEEYRLEYNCQRGLVMEFRKR